MTNTEHPFLILGGTGKTGSRVIDRLRHRGLPVRAGSRSGDAVELISYLFTDVLDGRNASLGDGVRRALGREPRDFADWAREAAATGVWNPA